MRERLVGFSCLFVAACFATHPPTGYVKGNLAGQINGQDWAYKHAYIDPTIKTPNEDDVVFVFLPFVPKDKCPRTQDDPPDSRLIMVSAPQTPKQVKIKAGTPRNLVFQYDDDKGTQIAKSAKKGKLKITSVTDETVVGKVYAQVDSANWVSGNFAAVVCNSLDLR